MLPAMPPNERARFRRPPSRPAVEPPNIRPGLAWRVLNRPALSARETTPGIPTPKHRRGR
jgi:hypothetical protein